jgi:hypothetical protein
MRRWDLKEKTLLTCLMLSTDLYILQAWEFDDVGIILCLWSLPNK